MSQWLVDTNVISELMNVVPNPAVEQWVAKQKEFFVSVVTLDEIYTGLAFRSSSKKTKWFEKFVALHCKVLSVTSEVAQLSGTLRGELRRKGIQRTQADMLLAATARLHKLTLVTRNSRDFQDCDIHLLNPFLDKSI